MGNEDVRVSQRRRDHRQPGVLRLRGQVRARAGRDGGARPTSTTPSSPMPSALPSRPTARCGSRGSPESTSSCRTTTRSSSTRSTRCPASPPSPCSRCSGRPRGCRSVSVIEELIALARSRHARRRALRTHRAALTGVSGRATPGSRPARLDGVRRPRWAQVRRVLRAPHLYRAECGHDVRGLRERHLGGAPRCGPPHHGPARGDRVRRPTALRRRRRRRRQDHGSSRSAWPAACARARSSPIAPWSPPSAARQPTSCAPACARSASRASRPARSTAPRSGCCASTVSCGAGPSPSCCPTAAGCWPR